MNEKTDVMRTNSTLPFWVVTSLVLCGGALFYFRAPLEDRATRSHAAIQYQLGNCSLQGIGLSRNPAKAAKWYRLAAEQGHVKAQTALGKMYLQGAGVPMSYEAAVKWFRRAADQGVAAAENQLGMMYAQGKGVAQDFDEASKWFSRAADHGCSASRGNLRLIAAARPAHMDRLAVRDGTVYQGVDVQKIELDGLTISYHPRRGGVGMAKVAFKDLPEQLQQKYGFAGGPKPTQVASSAQLAVVVLHTL